MNKQYDHLGNEFKSLSAMLKHYKISKNCYKKRMKKGMSLEECLTTPLRTFVCMDHNGIEYNSVEEMCQHYNISFGCYKNRLKAGYTQQEALTIPVNGLRNTSVKMKCNSKKHLRICYDHLGREYCSIEDMCKHYGISDSMYRNRIRYGWSLEKVLTTPKVSNGDQTRSKEEARTDHNGKIFNSKKEMCAYYHMSVTAYNKKIEKGYTKRETLLKIKKRIPKVSDHLGNRYYSIKDMCVQYGISQWTYNKRIKSGMNLQEALTYKASKNKCMDHLGKEYDSISDMCRFYKISRSCYEDRIRRGLSLEESLTMPLYSDTVGKECKDYLGNVYVSITDMCNNYGISPKTYKNRILKGVTLKDALTLSKSEIYKKYSGSFKKDIKRTTKASKMIKSPIDENIYFSSVREMCEYYNVPVYTYRSRLRGGMSPQDALISAINKPGNLKYKIVKDHFGNVYPSLTALCKQYDIGRATFESRIKLGMPIEIALTLPVIDKFGKKGGKPQQDPINPDIWYSSKREMYDHYGVTDKIVWSRMQKQNMSFIDALTKPVTEQGKGDHCKKLKTPEGKVFKSRQKAYDYYGTNTKLVSSRVNTGWKYWDAVMTPLYATTPKSEIIKKIEAILDKYNKKNNYEVKREVRFEGLYSAKEEDKTVKLTKCNLLRFDFGIFKNDKPIIMIEGDGLQHDNPNNMFNTNRKGENEWEYRQKNDVRKEKYCKEKSLIFLRIKENTKDDVIEKRIKDALITCGLYREESKDFVIDNGNTKINIECGNNKTQSNPLVGYAIYFNRFKNNIPEPKTLS